MVQHETGYVNSTQRTLNLSLPGYPTIHKLPWRTGAPTTALSAINALDRQGWRFPQLNNPKRWENRANSLFTSATLPVPVLPWAMAAAFGALGLPLGTEPAINQVPFCSLKGAGSPRA